MPVVGSKVAGQPVVSIMTADVSVPPLQSARLTLVTRGGVAFVSTEVVITRSTPGMPLTVQPVADELSISKRTCSCVAANAGDVSNTMNNGAAWRNVRRISGL